MAITLHTHGNLDNGASSNQTARVAGLTSNAGDLITCEFTFGDATGATFTSVLDDVNNVNYTAAVSAHHNTTIGQWVGIYYFANSAASSAGGLDVTVRWSTDAGFGAASCQTWSGAATSNVLDTSFTQQQDVTSTANPTTGSNKTPTRDGELIIGGMLSANNTPTAGSNFTLIDSNTTTLYWPEYWIQTTATGTNAPYTMTSDSWTDQMAAFSPPITFFPDEDYWNTIRTNSPEPTISVF